MNKQEARSIVVEALHKTANVFNNSLVTDRLRSPSADVTLEEMQLDSLDLVEWSVEIESKTGLVIDTADLAGATRLSDVVQVILRKQNVPG